MKLLASVVLLLEALAVALAIPVAATTSGRGASAAWLLAAVAVALVVASGLARRPGGLGVGWALQAVVLATGLLVPAMFALGLVFLAVWIVALVYGGKADRIAAQNRAAVAREASTGTAPAGSEDPPASG